MRPPPDAVEAGQAFYTRRTLAIYDPMILGFFSRVAWRCPAARILEHYDRHVSANHLDVGAGSGYFPDHCRFPSPNPRLGLLDLNTACLEVAAKRLERYQPQCHTANVLEAIAIEVEPYDSVALNYLLHCLPDTMDEKSVAVANLAALANPGAVLFGATLLSGGVQRNWFARQVMARNNRVGIFSNADDTLDALRVALESHLDDPTVEVVGCVAVFAGRVPIS